MRVPVLAFVVVLLAAAVGLIVFFGRDRSVPGPDPDPLPPELAKVLSEAEYVGRKACAVCHAEEDEAWRGSHHDLAMDEATEKTVLGDFDDAEITVNGVTSRFYRKEGAFFVKTDGPDGRVAEFAVTHVFGVTPLQQYLVPFADGRYQVLPLCWDSRPEEQGGQRWYHIYPDERVPAGDVLHWTGPNQNWNFVCAECHSTDLRKNFDLTKRRYETAWAEIDVSCEACHGPGSAHVDWVEKTAGLAEKPVDWRTRTKMLAPMKGRPQIEICARCHSRRVQLSEDYLHGRPLMDTHRLTLLEERLYHADGQIKDEVYVYGSFVQSKMFAEGITCSDCHEVHSTRTWREGNALCVRCHDAGELDVKEHHFHEPGTEGSHCVDCHAPETTYMVVDPRRDHSFRVPRPDLSITLGVPNACNRCHDDQTNEWSLEYIVKWYGKDRRKEPHYGEALQAGREGKPGAARALAALIRDKSQPAIARATAVSLLQNFPGSAAASVMPLALSDPDPLVRAAALSAIEDDPPREIVELALPLLSDPVRVVRIQAALALVRAPPGRLSKKQRERLVSATAEYVTSELVNSDRGSSHTNLGNFHLRRGDPAAAERAYLTAISVEPGAMRAYVNLADLYRTTGQEERGEEILRKALVVAPDDAAIRHALGLLLVRRGRSDQAIVELERAAALLPSSPRFAYVFAVALDSVGEKDRALSVLEGARERHATDPEILFGLATMYRDRNRLPEAIVMAEKLVAVMPEDPNARRLLDSLRARHGR